MMDPIIHVLMASVLCGVLARLVSRGERIGWVLVPVIATNLFFALTS